METNPRHLNARAYIASLAAKGRYHFVSAEARTALGVSVAATKLALNRLVKQQLIASPARGFYVIIPPEYQSLGCLPADQFIPSLMQSKGLSYYVGLLSAAQYHGAAHHRPQEFQIVITKSHRPIHCGVVNVAFITRKRMTDVPIQNFNTPRGTILVSTPEATAVDIVGYHHHVGGLDQVATILAELAEKIDADKLVIAARTAPIPWVQRLGYLLEQVDASDLVVSLKAYVHQHAKDTVPLLPMAPHEHSLRNKDWKLYINVDVEAEQ